MNMEVVTKFCYQKLRLRLTSFLLASVILIYTCLIILTEPPVHQTELGEQLTDNEFKR